MAKKKTALTIEERLQQALVPAHAQPYDVPENWVWCRLGSVNLCLDAYRKPVNASERANRIGKIPYYGATGQVGWIDDYLTDEHLVLLGEDGAPFLDLLKDKAYIISGKAWVNNHAHILKSSFGEFGNWYLMHYLNTVDYGDYVKGTTRLKLTQGSMQIMPFPLPPLAEQKRIVDRIEVLFAKLDEAKEKLQEVIDGFAVRKAAILHKTFTGELTKKWRAENGVSDDSWEEKNFDEVANIKSNLVSPFDYLDYPHIAPDSIEKFTGRLLSYRSVREDNVKSPKHLFYKGQILYSKIRPYLSKAVIAEVDGLCSADMYPIEALCNAKYLLRYMLSTEFLVQSTTAGSRSLLPKINQKELSAIKVPLPSLSEQHEIVRLLDALLARERKAQQAAKEALANIELMKKAVLARAFRGELGTNREEEASALALLKEVLE